MTDSIDEQGLGLSAGDQLLLQQLLTRQALTVGADSSDTNDEDIVSEDILAAVNNQDEKWRLLPEDFSPHDWQKRCLEMWLPLRRGTVKVATGGGKTLFALAAAQALQNTHDPDLRLIVVVPTIPLMFQWRDEFKDSNIPASQIALMGGGEALGNLAGIKVLIAVLDSAREKLPALIKDSGSGEHLLLVVDECHRTNAAKSSKIFDVGAAYTLGLSATPETGSGEEGISSDQQYAAGVVGQALGPIIFEFSLRESLSAGLLAEFQVLHIGLTLEPDEAASHAKLSKDISELRKGLQVQHRRSRSSQGFIAWCQTMAGKESSSDASRFIGLTSERKRLLFRAKARSDFALRVLQASMVDPDSRAIVFHESINEINSLFGSALRAGIPAVLEHSDLKAPLRAGNINAFRAGVARVIVSGKSLIEGFNVPSADTGIIAASSGSIRQRIQSLGRMLRKKETATSAVIFVLYIKDTEDEAIYEKADWEAIIGAEQNRYFLWTLDPEKDQQPANLAQFIAKLEEVGVPPRTYRPPCYEIDAATLQLDTIYPGQTHGDEVRVDQANNLRSIDGGLIKAPANFIQKILDTNSHKRATITPCGQLICRQDSGRGASSDWIYIGDLEFLKTEENESVEKLAIKQVSGRRVIAKKSGRDESFARGPDKASNQEAGAMRDSLLSWTLKVEKELSTAVRELYWDGDCAYWLEINGQKIPFDGASAKLEFR